VEPTLKTKVEEDLKEVGGDRLGGIFYSHPKFLIIARGAMDFPACILLK
jgi:hypothetical protein